MNRSGLVHRLSPPCLALLWAAGACCALLVCMLGTLAAQEPAGKTTAAAKTKLTPEIVQQRAKAATESTKLNEAQKAKVEETYKQALDSLAAAAQATAKREAFQQQIDSADADLQEARRELFRLPEAPQTSLELLDTVELTERLEIKSAELARARQNAAEREAAPRLRVARRLEIAEELQKASRQLSNVEQQIAKPPPPETPEELVLAEQTRLAAQRLALRAEISALQREQAMFDATAAQLPVLRELSARRVSLLDQELGRIREEVSDRLRTEVDQQIREAESIRESSPTALNALAESILALAKERAEVRTRIEETEEQTARQETLLQRLEEQFRSTKTEVDLVGLTDAIGLKLRKQRQVIPDVRSYRRRSKLHQEQIRQDQRRLFELQERRGELDDLGLQTNRVVNQTGAAESEVRSLLETEREYLDLLIPDYNTSFARLVELDNKEKGVIAQSEQYLQYIDERVLWIRSAPPLSFDDLKRSTDALLWLADTQQWQHIGRGLVNDAAANPLIWLAALAVIALLLVYARRMNSELLAIGQRVAQPAYHQFWPTVQAFALTALTAALGPVVIAFAGWRLLAMETDSPLGDAVGDGLLTTAHVFLLLSWLRQTCRARGLAGAHFGWTDTDLTRLRRILRWTMLLTLPLLLVATTIHAQEIQTWRDSLGRICFAAMTVVLALVLYGLLRPRRGILWQVLTIHHDNWLYSLRYVWSLLGLAAPLVLAALAVIGYYYTAHRLLWRLEASAWLLFGLALAASLLLRWVLINRRRLAIRQARQRLEEARREAADAEAEPGEAPGAATPPPEIDLPTINTQTRRLLLTILSLVGLVGLWAIWVDVLPALRFLDEVTVWETRVLSTDTVTAPDGTTTTRTIESVQPITLVDLGIALLILVMTLAAARNIPGLMEMAVLQRLPMDAALRYTVTTVSRYLIVLVGILLTCGALNIEWSKVQWLVAALTVGLGFGLQEIFANFVSGLILLVERPVRVGDLVTIGNINGTVSEIRMRATTIRDWNRRELVVPNKELITGQLINWTLSDSTYRVDLQVGIAYGSDVTLARELLLKVAGEHPKVLEKPKPKSIFLGFGESALNFELRIFIPHMDYWPRVVSEINTAIEATFREAGIVIAYPQRDLHIRSIAEPLPVRSVE